MATGRNKKPDIHKGDRIGFDVLKHWDTEKDGVLRNGYAVSEPFQKKGVWYISANMNEERMDKYLKEYYQKHDFNIPTSLVYVVEPNKLSRIKQRIISKMKLSRPAIVTGIVIAFIALIGLWFAGNYNDLVRAKNSVENSRAQIDTELTRRYDLIDNVVASVQGSQAQESDVFGKIAEARKIGASSQDITSEQSQQANQTIDTQIALLPRLQEAYPELRSNDQVTRLITELQGTNNTIRDKRNAYNETVTNYNNNITSFPKNIFAGVFGFGKEKLFTATAEERVNPKVDLSRDKENQ